MSFTTADVVKLRKVTGAGMMDCKRALTEAEGDMEKAEEILRKKGIASAGKKASRAAKEVRMAVPVRPSKPSGLTMGSMK